jgi:hypothetical protein
MPEMTCCALLKTYQKVFKKYLKRNSETHRSQLQPLDEMQEKVGLLDKEETPNSELDFVAASLLNHKIAPSGCKAKCSKCTLAKLSTDCLLTLYAQRLK